MIRPFIILLLVLPCLLAGPTKQRFVRTWDKDYITGYWYPDLALVETPEDLDVVFNSILNKSWFGRGFAKNMAQFLIDRISEGKTGMVEQLLDKKQIKKNKEIVKSVFNHKNLSEENLNSFYVLCDKDQKGRHKYLKGWCIALRGNYSLAAPKLKIKPKEKEDSD